MDREKSLRQLQLARLVLIHEITNRKGVVMMSDKGMSQLSYHDIDVSYLNEDECTLTLSSVNKSPKLPSEYQDRVLFRIEMTLKYLIFTSSEQIIIANKKILNALEEKALEFQPGKGHLWVFVSDPKIQPDPRLGSRKLSFNVNDGLSITEDLTPDAIRH